MSSPPSVGVSHVIVTEVFEVKVVLSDNGLPGKP